MIPIVEPKTQYCDDPNSSGGKGVFIATVWIFRGLLFDIGV